MRRTCAMLIAVALGGCCKAEPTQPEKVEAASALWRVDAEQVQAIEASVGDQRITITRDDPVRAWCRVATEVPNKPTHVVEFPVEPQAAGELFRSIAAPEVRQTLDDTELENEDEVRVTIAGKPAQRLLIGPSEGDALRVFDPTTDAAYVVADRWWRTLEGAQRLLPLRNLVERRGLERVTIQAQGRMWSLALRDGAWVPEDPQVDRSSVEPIVLETLRLRPGTFDRALDPSTLQSVVRLEFEGGARPQTLELLTAGSDAYFLSSTRATGLAKAHHIAAREVAAKVDAL